MHSCWLLKQVGWYTVIIGLLRVHINVQYIYVSKTKQLPVFLPTENLYTFLVAFMCYTPPAHFILLDLIVLPVLDQKYKLSSCSLINFVCSPVTSSLLGRHILLWTWLPPQTDIPTLQQNVTMVSIVLSNNEQRRTTLQEQDNIWVTGLVLFVE